MSQDHQHHHEGGHASHKAASTDDQGPGKRSLTEAGPDDVTASAASLKSLKDETRDAYVGDGKFANRGILDHKIDGVNDMRQYLTAKDDPSVGAKALQAAITI